MISLFLLVEYREFLQHRQYNRQWKHFDHQWRVGNRFFRTLCTSPDMMYINLGNITKINK